MVQLVISIVPCPCKDCEKKGCGTYHSQCKKYNDYNEKNKKQRKVNRHAVLANCDVMDMVNESRKKKNRF